MALNATVYTLTVELADVDRNVYESLDLRMAREPSESAGYFFVRLLAYCLEYAEGISFSFFSARDVVRHPMVQRIVRALKSRRRAWHARRLDRQAANSALEGALLSLAIAHHQGMSIFVSHMGMLLDVGFYFGF